MNRIRLVAMSAIAAVFFVSVITTANEPDIATAIKAAHERGFAKLAEADFADAVTTYTEDAMLLPPGSDFVVGRQAIEAFFRTVSGGQPLILTVDPLEVEKVGEDTAIEVAEFQITTKDGQLVDSGKAIHVWKQIDGVWKIHRDIWNQNG